MSILVTLLGVVLMPLGVVVALVVLMRSLGDR